MSQVSGHKNIRIYIVKTDETGLLKQLNVLCLCCCML